MRRSWKALKWSMINCIFKCLKLTKHKHRRVALVLPLMEHLRPNPHFLHLQALMNIGSICKTKRHIRILGSNQCWNRGRTMTNYSNIQKREVAPCLMKQRALGRRVLMSQFRSRNLKETHRVALSKSSGRQSSPGALTRPGRQLQILSFTSRKLLINISKWIYTGKKVRVEVRFHSTI